MKTPTFVILFLGLFSCFATNSQAQTKLFFEKVYIHTDREMYAPGEEIWFSAYLVNAQNNNFINSSNTLYTELVHNDKSQEVVSKEILRLEKGKGNGDFKLNDSIAPGSYTLRAYTNWMRNFGQVFIFEKQIQIADINNSPKVADKGLVNTKTGKTLTNKNTSPVIIKQENIQFMPEGGAMVDSVGGLVAFKAVDGAGKSLGLKGEITNSKGDVVTEIKTESGVGAFYFVPLPNEVYTVKGLYNNGKSFEQKLPKPLTSGFAMRVNDKDSVINVILSSNSKTVTNGKQGLLVAKCRGKIYANVQFNLASPQVLVQIKKDDLPDGINAITFYDETGKPNCERLIYVDKKDSPILSITADKPIYDTKEKATLHIKITDSHHKPIKTTFSFAATDANLIKANESNIVSYLMLESELLGKIEQPTQYFNTDNSGKQKQLDLLLLTQGWRDFIWRHLEDTPIKITEVAESGITVTGKVKQVLLEKPIYNANVSMFANGAKGDKLFAGKTDSAGIYHLDGLELYGDQKIKLTSATDKGKKNGWITLDSLYKDIVPKPFVPTLTAQPIDKSFVEEIKKRVSVMRKANLRDTIQLKEVTVRDKNTRLFDRVVSDFGYPVEDFKVTKADYDYYSLKLFLMDKSGGIREVDDPHDAGKSILAYPVFGKFVQPRVVINNKEQPFTDADAQYVKNDYYDTYWNLPMSKVERVVIKHLVGSPLETNKSPEKEDIGASISGSGLASADSTGPGQDVFIIYLTLKPGALDKKIFNSIIEDVSGYYQAKSFYRPQYGEDVLTDQRTTINWAPTVITNENGEATVTYYNAGLKAKVNVFVEGLTSGGNPVAGNASYLVK
nr:MG2 domain-containing protein [uncultured Pedobacter sp.]